MRMVTVISRAALGVAMGTAVILAAASRLLSAADAGAFAMASGVLQQRLGISPRTGTLDRSAGSPAACRQLPARICTIRLAFDTRPTTPWARPDC
jgi:hypothetical protein